MKSMTKNNCFLQFCSDRSKAKETDVEELGDSYLGVVEFELFDADCPRTAKNFRTLCSQEKGKGKSGVPLCYLLSPVHRVVQKRFIQGGDFVKGTGGFGESIFGGTFKDEAPGLKKVIDVPGLLCMANSGKNSNTSQFFITLGACPDLSGKHVVFGRVVRGMEVVERIAALQAANDDGEEGFSCPAPFVWQCGVCDK